MIASGIFSEPFEHSDSSCELPHIFLVIKKSKGVLDEGDEMQEVTLLQTRLFNRIFVPTPFSSLSKCGADD